MVPITIELTTQGVGFREKCLGPFEIALEQLQLAQAPAALGVLRRDLQESLEVTAGGTARVDGVLQPE